MSYSVPCAVSSNDPTVKPINQCYLNPTNGRIHSLLITGAGVSIPCYTDSDLIHEHISRDANYASTLFDGTTAHPNAGSANPNNSTAHLLIGVEGEIGEPTENTRESIRSFDKSTTVIDYDFSIDITTYYHPDNQEWYDDVAAGKYGDVVITLEDALSFKVNNPSISILTVVEDEELVVKYRIAFTQFTGNLPFFKSVAPLWTASA